MRSFSPPLGGVPISGIGIYRRWSRTNQAPARDSSSTLCRDEFQESAVYVLRKLQGDELVATTDRVPPEPPSRCHSSHVHPALHQRIRLWYYHCESTPVVYETCESSCLRHCLTITFAVLNPGCCSSFLCELRRQQDFILGSYWHRVLSDHKTDL